MTSPKKIFLTGMTGFLGGFLAKELLLKGHKIYALVRKKTGKSSDARAFEALRFAFLNKCDQHFIRSKVKIVEGDIVADNLNISNKERNFLESSLDIIIHCAALAELTMPLKVIREVNVEGTRNVFNFANCCKKKGPFKEICYISTIYVAGCYRGYFDETIFDADQNFNNTYEQSKFEAERLVRKYMNKNFNIKIFRPSMIIGDTQNGRTYNFKLFYQPLYHFKKHLFQVYPANLQCSQNLINIDTVTSAIVCLINNVGDQVYHIISPRNYKVGSFLKFAAKFFKYKMPRYVPAEKFNFDNLTAVEKALVMPFVPYFNNKIKFCADRTYKELNRRGFVFPVVNEENLLKIFSYCLNSGFIKG